MFRGLLCYQNYGGKRDRKVYEPPLEATQDDYLIAEMENMAIDFEEERMYKIISAMKLAREAVKYI